MKKKRLMLSGKHNLKYIYPFLHSWSIYTRLFYHEHGFVCVYYIIIGVFREWSTIGKIIKLLEKRWILKRNPNIICPKEFNFFRFFLDQNYNSVYFFPLFPHVYEVIFNFEHTYTTYSFMAVFNFYCNKRECSRFCLN